MNYINKLYYISKIYSHHSVDRGSSVRTYLDCHWITTQILHKHSLLVPTDTDLIVGYMFQVRICHASPFLTCLDI